MNMTSSNSDTPPLELSRLNDITGGDTEIMNQLLNLFLTDVVEFTTKLKQALKDNDNEEFCHAAHRIKGGAGQVGAHTLHTLSATLEIMGRENNLNKAQETMDAFNQEYERLVDYLEQTIQS